HRTLRRPALAGKEPPVCIAPGLQHCLDEAQHPAIGYTFRDQREKLGVIHRSEGHHHTLPTISTFQIA
ncbi:MAG: hypothetical protein WA869_20815, partial [Alloacidobacterium sp.]